MRHLSACCALWLPATHREYKKVEGGQVGRPRVQPARGITGAGTWIEVKRFFIATCRLSAMGRDDLPAEAVGAAAEAVREPSLHAQKRIRCAAIGTATRLLTDTDDNDLTPLLLVSVPKRLLGPTRMCTGACCLWLIWREPLPFLVYKHLKRSTFQRLTKHATYHREL